MHGDELEVAVTGHGDIEAASRWQGIPSSASPRSPSPSSRRHCSCWSRTAGSRWTILSRSGCPNWRHRWWSALRRVRWTTWSPPSGRSLSPTCSTSRAGYGFPSDFSLPAVAPLFDRTCRSSRRDPAGGHRAGRMDGGAVPGAAASSARRGVAVQHLLRYPGCADRHGCPADRCQNFCPSGSSSRWEWSTPDSLSRRTSSIDSPAITSPTPAGGLVLADAPEGHWSRPPTFPSGAGGLVSTVDDWLAFARMLLGAGIDRRRPRTAVARCGPGDDDKSPDPRPT